MTTENATLQELVDIMAILRSPNGCPWDREQSFATIKDYLLEETFEAYEAARTLDFEGLAEELGDVLFEVVFLSRLAEEAGAFDIAMPIRLVRDKLIRRHPHVFGDAVVKDSGEVLANWQKIKSAEADKQDRESELDGIPRSLPALLQAYRLSVRAGALGFDWQKTGDVFAKVEEELGELKRAVAEAEPRQRLSEELGDLLFVLVNLARFLDIQPHDALQSANDKFRARFAHVERLARRQGGSVKDFDMDTLESFWQDAKDNQIP